MYIHSNIYSQQHIQTKYNHEYDFPSIFSIVEQEAEVLLVKGLGGWEFLAVDEGGEEWGPFHYFLVAWAAGNHLLMVLVLTKL